MCVQHVRLNALGQLREKSRIFLEHSGFLFGVLDELGVLGENQVWMREGVHQGGWSCRRGLWVEFGVQGENQVWSGGGCRREGQAANIGHPNRGRSAAGSCRCIYDAYIHASTTLACPE